jgi:hypothetical protein
MTQEQLQIIKGWLSVRRMEMANEAATATVENDKRKIDFYIAKMAVLEDLETRLDKADGRTYDTSEDTDAEDE